MDVATFPIVAGSIYICAGIGFRTGLIPPSNRRWIGSYPGRLIVPDKVTVPLDGFNALEDPAVWYPVSRRSAVLLITFGFGYLALGLASKLLSVDWLGEDRAFLIFLIVLVLGQLLTWLFSYWTAKTLVRRLALVGQ